MNIQERLLPLSPPLCGCIICGRNKREARSPSSPPRRLIAFSTCTYTQTRRVFTAAGNEIAHSPDCSRMPGICLWIVLPPPPPTFYHRKREIERERERSLIAPLPTHNNTSPKPAHPLWDRFLTCLRLCAVVLVARRHLCAERGNGWQRGRERKGGGGVTGGEDVERKVTEEVVVVVVGVYLRHPLSSYVSLRR